MKTTDSDDYEAFMEMTKAETKKRSTYAIKDIVQEKMFLESMTKYLESNDTISKDIFDRFSHELRTPIVVIKAYADMILDGKYGELTPLQKEKLTIVEENTVLLIDTIMKMLEKIKERE